MCVCGSRYVRYFELRPDINGCLEGVTDVRW